jgi:hypothetical protein
MRCVFLPRTATTEFQMPPKRAQIHLHNSRGDETCSDVSAGPRKQVVFPTGGGGTHDWGLSRQPVVVCVVSWSDPRTTAVIRASG